jgi:hypothetical protein
MAILGAALPSDRVRCRGQGLPIGRRWCTTSPQTLRPAVERRTKPTHRTQHPRRPAFRDVSLPTDPEQRDRGTFFLSSVAVVIAGALFRGISTKRVTPPATAAFVPVSKPAQSMEPFYGVGNKTDCSTTREALQASRASRVPSHSTLPGSFK